MSSSLRSRDQTQVFLIAGGFFTSWATIQKPKNTGIGSLSILQQIFQTQEMNGWVSHIAGGFFISWATTEAQIHIFLHILFLWTGFFKKCMLFLKFILNKYEYAKCLKMKFLKIYYENSGQRKLVQLY